MSYEVKTPVFEGPLDLLLQLITSHRLEVTELSLSDLVSEYLRYLELMQDLDLEVTSEFLVIAATLVQLKARSLLPGDTEVDLDEELFKDVAAVLAARLESTALLLPRSIGLDIDVEVPETEVRIPADPQRLARIAEDVLTRGTEDPDLDHLDLDLPSVSDAIAELRRRIDAEIETDFERVTSHLGRPIEVVAYFLAVLELARWGLVEARQDDIDAAIVLRTTGRNRSSMISEWDLEGA